MQQPHEYFSRPTPPQPRPMRLDSLGLRARFSDLSGPVIGAEVLVYVACGMAGSVSCEDHHAVDCAVDVWRSREWLP